jgi:CubicO group peptidase (beta-lactamase class C family)
MFEQLDRGEVPGLVTLVGRDGDVQVETTGTTAVGGTEPMRRDTVFRISSLTKPIAAAATLRLVEDGLLTLDLFAFARMLLAGGSHLGRRILSTESVTVTTTDWLTPAQREVSDAAPVFLGDSGWGFGLGVEPARYGWSGGLGTTWYTYPDDGLIAVLMTQWLPPPAHVFEQFWHTVEHSRG